MNRTRVVNMKREEFDVDITRSGPWGNPFPIGMAGNRTGSIEKYRAWITTQPDLLAQLPGLRGKRLGCVCKPKACHGDVLVELIEGPDPEPAQRSLL
jgi:hypothetical protein